MKVLFDSTSQKCSKLVTRHYSTSFSLATRMLAKSIRQDIYNIYGFVRLADEIVDTFHDFDKRALFNRFEYDLELALSEKISLNPILNAFQHTYHKYNIDKHLVDAFMASMRMDLDKSKYVSREEFQQYIYGSADVVGLMCLKVFVRGDMQRYEDVMRNSRMRPWR
jgi:phytoene/squalene synthetase